jgi:hypothetical protein
MCCVWGWEFYTVLSDLHGSQGRMRMVGDGGQPQIRRPAGSDFFTTKSVQEATASAPGRIQVLDTSISLLQTISHMSCVWAWLTLFYHPGAVPFGPCSLLVCCNRREGRKEEAFQLPWPVSTPLIVFLSPVARTSHKVPKLISRKARKYKWDHEYMVSTISG